MRWAGQVMASALTVEQLQAVAVALGCGSPAAAARRVGRSKAFVMGAIRAVEQTLDTRLLVRHGTGWRVTEQGLASVGHLTDMLGEFDRFASCAEAASHSRVGSLDVLVALQPGLLPLGVWATRTSRHDPLSQIVLRFGGAVDADESTDLLLSSTASSRPGWFCNVLGDLPFAAFASSAYLASSPAPCTPDTLGEHVLLETSGNDAVGFGELLDSAYDRAYVFATPIRPAVRAGTWIDVYHAVLDDGGIGILPVHAVMKDLQAGNLIRVLPGWARLRCGCSGPVVRTCWRAPDWCVSSTSRSRALVRSMSRLNASR